MEPPSAPAACLGVTRALILHVDDLGMCRGGNRAFAELARRGLVTCSSVMLPCPFFEEVAALAAADPMLDIGVHLTLTSEWEHLRWRPLSTRSPASGLIDADGFFWRDVASLRRHMVVEAAEAELRAQVERALAAGLRPTHCDAHMAAAMLPELLGLHVRLAREHGMVPALPRAIRFAPDPTAYAAAVAALDADRLPLPDHFRGTLAVPEDEAEAAYRALVLSLPPGVTHTALHCTADRAEMAAIAPAHAGWRAREYELLAAGRIAAWCAEAGVATLGYAAIQPFWPAPLPNPAPRR